jgi:hypothetical protein
MAMSFNSKVGRKTIMWFLGTGRIPVISLFASFIMALLLCAGAVPVNAEPRAFDEYAIKAGFVYNFAKFVEWPADAFRDSQSPLVICIVGNDPFGSKLDVLENKTVLGRKLVIRRLAILDDILKCQGLFISRSENSQLPAILKAARNKNILTISEAPNFCRSGGMINLFLDGDKVRFEINIRNAEKARLKISSHLLNLAKICREDN